MASPFPYAADLAFIHDSGFGDLARHAARLLLARLEESGIHSGVVLDLGCGSGILSEAMAASGFTPHGVDLSPEMIALARERVPNGHFQVASVLDTKVPQCVAVAAIGEVLSYRFDARDSVRRLARLLGRIYRALPRGGRFLFDLATPGRAPRSGAHGFREGPDWAIHFEAREDATRRLLERRIVTFRVVTGDATSRAGGVTAAPLYRRSEEHHTLSLVPPREMLSGLRQVGFRVRTSSSYGALRLPRGLTVFDAWKP